MPPDIRRADPDELDAVGRLTVDAYVSGGVIPADAPYLAFLGDATSRDAEAELWVAVDARGVVGTVTYVEPGSALCEIARDGGRRRSARSPWRPRHPGRGSVRHSPGTPSSGPASTGSGRWCSRRRRRCTPRTGSTSGSASPGCPSATGRRCLGSSSWPTGSPCATDCDPPTLDAPLPGAWRWVVAMSRMPWGVRWRGGAPRRSWRQDGWTPRRGHRAPRRRPPRCRARARCEPLARHPGVVATGEPLEDPWRSVSGMPGPSSVTDDPHERPLGAHPRHDPGAGRGVRARVGEQVGQDLVQPGLVAGRPSTGSSGRSSCQAWSGPSGVRVAHGVDHERR